jgi:hypothetical protein
MGPNDRHQAAPITSPTRNSEEAHHLGQRIGAIPRNTMLDIGQLNLANLGAVPVGVNDLGMAVQRNATAPARPRSLVAVLGQSIETLNDAIKTRNAQVVSCQRSRLPLNKKVPIMFGLPQKDFIDERYAGTMREISRKTDDCIFFSRLLCVDLADHGEGVRHILKLRFGKEAPRISRVDWSDVVKKGLLPEDDDYSSWLTGFPRRVAKTYGRKTGKVWYRIRKTWRTSVSSAWKFLLAWGPSVWVLIQYSVTTAIVSAVLLIAYRQLMMRVVEPLWRWVFG